MNIKIRKEPVQADVLIIGGGISGMQAAHCCRRKGCRRHRCRKSRYPPQWFRGYW